MRGWIVECSIYEPCKFEVEVEEVEFCYVLKFVEERISKETFGIARLYGIDSVYYDRFAYLFYLVTRESGPSLNNASAVVIGTPIKVPVWIQSLEKRNIAVVPVRDQQLLGPP